MHKSNLSLQIAKIAALGRKSKVAVDPKPKRNPWNKFLSLLKTLKEAMLHLAFFLVILFIFIFIFKDSSKKTIIVEPFLVAKKIPEILGGDYLAFFLRHEIKSIVGVNSALEFKDGKHIKSLVAISRFQEESFEIKDPLTGLNLTTLKSFVQQSLFKNKVVYRGVIDKDSIGFRFSLETSNGRSLQYNFKNNSDLLKVLNQIAKDIVKNEDPYKLGIYLLSKNQNLEECLEISQAMLNNENPDDDIKALNLRGNYHFRKYFVNHDLQYLNTAQNEWKQILEENSEIPSVLNAVGVTYFYMGDPNSSLEYYKKAIEQDNKFSGAYLNMGNSYWYKSETDSINPTKNLDLAISSYKKAIEVKRHDSKPYISLANVLWQKNQKEEAIKYFKKVMEMDLDDPFGYHQLGLKYYQQESRDNALFYLSKADSLYKIQKKKPVLTTPILDTMIIKLKDTTLTYWK